MSNGTSPGKGGVSAQTFEYTSVTIESFFDKDEMKKNEVKTGIIVLTPHQNDLVNKLIVKLTENAPEKIERIQSRLDDVEKLAAAIAQFPSLLERTNMTSSVRTPEALVESLVSYQDDGDTTLHMPSKAILGKGFLVAKIHTFYSMSRLAKLYTDMSDKEVKEYTDETVSMMFTLMAEDVYINLIHDTTLSMDLRRQLANSLIILWEHRADQTISDIAPVLQEVWSARRTLAPAFGTMMGTSELLLVSLQMDEQWTLFIKKRLGDPEVSQAMEEFLFGISYEQIGRLRSILKEQGIRAIGRDYRDFYLLYTVRRDNARARQRLHLEGPKKTLEDHFIRFVLEAQQEKQNMDPVISVSSDNTKL